MLRICSCFRMKHLCWALWFVSQEKNIVLSSKWECSLLRIAGIGTQGSWIVSSALLRPECEFWPITQAAMQLFNMWPSLEGRGFGVCKMFCVS